MQDFVREKSGGRGGGSTPHMTYTDGVCVMEMYIIFEFSKTAGKQGGSFEFELTRKQGKFEIMARLPDKDLVLASI